MSVVSDIFSSVFDVGGGGGGSGASDYAALLEWFRQQDQEQQQLSAREKETAGAITAMRTGDLADRTGYAGTVNVGAAKQTTDATVAEYISGLRTELQDKGRPKDWGGAVEAMQARQQVKAYDAGIAKEQQQTAANWNIITGQQYDAEDAVKAIMESVSDSESSLSAAIASLQAVGEKYNFYDVSGQLADLQERLRKLRNPFPGAGPGDVNTPNDPQAG